MQDYEKRVYTLQEIAKILQRPRSTVDSWRDLFEEYLPTIGEGRNRRYKREALNIFETISQMKDAHETNEEIRRYLSSLVTEITVSNEDEAAPPFLRNIYNGYMEVLEENAKILEENVRLREELQEIKESQSEMNNKLDILINQGKTDNNEAITNDYEEVVEENNEVEEEKKEEKKSFWVKLFGG